MIKYLIFIIVCYTSMSFIFKEKGALEIKNNNFGTFSISLAVMDIKKSLFFYEKLGFIKVEGAGSVESKWLILKKDKIKIGLFQDMFPKNTITFNPDNARHIFKELKKKNIRTVFSNGLDQEEGPCSFSVLDPDGNPILFDQH